MIMTSSNELFQKAQILALSYDFDKALELIDSLLVIESDSTELIRFKGNTLDFKASVAYESGILSLKKIHQIRLSALECYEFALEKSPEYVPLIIDIGDYWLNKHEYQIAVRYFDRAISLW